MKTEHIKGFFVIWAIVLLINQFVFFGGALAPYCLIAGMPHTAVISLVISYFLFKKNSKEKNKTTSHKQHPSKSAPQKTERIKETTRKRHTRFTTPPRPSSSEDDPLKAMGDKYEKYIGEKLEEKGDIVIYNGFIMGYEDQGVDIISITPTIKTINLIQCKNWKKKSMTVEELETVYKKLLGYILNFYDFSPETINRYSIKHYDNSTIGDLFIDIETSPEKYTIRKTLYASSDKVIDLEVGRYVEMIKANIFRYKDMKIVFVDQ